MNQEKVQKAAEDYSNVQAEGLNKFGEMRYSSESLNALETRHLKIPAFIAGCQYGHEEVVKYILRVLRENYFMHGGTEVAKFLETKLKEKK